MMPLKPRLNSISHSSRGIEPAIYTNCLGRIKKLYFFYFKQKKVFLLKVQAIQPKKIFFRLLLNDIE